MEIVWRAVWLTVWLAACAKPPPEPAPRERPVERGPAGDTGAAPQANTSGAQPDPGRPTADPPAPRAQPTPPGDDPDEGPIAGPRNIVEQAPPTLDPDLPGRGPMVAYMGAIRTVVMASFRDCWIGTSGPPPRRPALVGALLDADGTVVDLTLSQDSGSVELDTCALEAFGSATLPPPPEVLLSTTGADGQPIRTSSLRTSDMAFVPVAP